MAVTDAERGAGASTANSPTTCPRPASTRVRSPTWTRTLPFGDDEEPVLDGAALDDPCARLDRHLLEELATATSMWPGTSLNSSTRCRTATRSIVKSARPAHPPTRRRCASRQSAGDDRGRRVQSVTSR